MTQSKEDLILALVQALDTKVDTIQTSLATHEERSHSLDGRIGRIEKVGSGITLALVAAVLGVMLSGCGIFSALKPPASPAAPSAPVVDVVARAVANTVALETPDGDRFCSGVAAEGIIITADHCVNDGEAFVVRFGGKTFVGAVVDRDVPGDVAFVDAIGARLKDSVPLAEKEPVLGAKLIWTGYPLGLDFMMGLGIAGNPNYQTPMLGEGYWLAVYGQFIPGNSGGPVFNGKGELVGIVSSLMATPGHAWPVGIAAPLSVLKNHLH